MSGALQHLPTLAWSCTLLSCLSISSLPWRICSSHQAAYRTSLLCAFLHAAALRVSSLSELKILSKDTIPWDNVSSSSETTSSASAGASSPSPERTTSGDAERDRSELPEPLSSDAWDSSQDPTSDSSSEPDPDELELLEPDMLPEPLSDPELEPGEEELDIKP